MTYHVVPYHTIIEHCVKLLLAVIDAIILCEHQHQGPGPGMPRFAYTTAYCDVIYLHPPPNSAMILILEMLCLCTDLGTRV